MSKKLFAVAGNFIKIEHSPSATTQSDMLTIKIIEAENRDDALGKFIILSWKPEWKLAGFAVTQATENEDAHMEHPEHRRIPNTDESEVIKSLNSENKKLVKLINQLLSTAENWEGGYSELIGELRTIVKSFFHR